MASVESKREINEYLCHEFGLADETNEVSEEWPFVLEDLGGFEHAGEHVEVYRFSDGEDVYYATAGAVLDFIPAAGMELNDLRVEALGSRWIADRNPIDLDTSRLGDPSVPSTRVRRTAIQQLARESLPSIETHRILEGLFLQSTGDYLALVADPNSPDHALLIGTAVPAQRVEFPKASRHRRVSIGVGRLLEAGTLPPSSGPPTA